jgi:hypothetical protein
MLAGMPVDKRATLTLLVGLGVLILAGQFTHPIVVAIILAMIAGSITFVAMTPQEKSTPTPDNGPGKKGSPAVHADADPDESAADGRPSG